MIVARLLLVWVPCSKYGMSPHKSKKEFRLTVIDLVTRYMAQMVSCNSNCV